MNGTQLVVSLVGLVALGHTITDYLRALANFGDKASRSAFVSQTIAYLVFVAVIFLAASDTGLFGQIAIVGDTTIADLSWAAKILVGLMLGGIGGVLYGFKQARDNTDSAAVPPFIK